MNRTRHSLFAGVALLVPYSCFAGPATAETASLGLTSTRPSGAVSVQTDPVLASGRLVMKVAAHNSTDRTASLSSTDVKVFVGDKEIALLSVDQLIAEVRGANSADRSMNSSHQTSNYSRPQMSTTGSGELDVTGVSGANDAVGRAVSERSSSPSGGKSDPATEVQVEALKAGILQTLELPPKQASGAQVVTEKIKFGRKDPRVVRVVVSFNGDTHQFEFEAPRAK